MSQALYRKWRPHLWDEVVAQEHVVRTLQNAIRSDRVAHAYLFAGPRGTGKTTTARLLAKAVNCLAENLDKRPCNECEHCVAVNENRFLDLIEIDAASNTSVDDVRDLRDKINFSPSQGRFKVYIIDEVHMLSTAAFNALLKTLEEPPPHAIFILATTEVHKIPATVLSRCQWHEFRRIPLAEITRRLSDMAESEGLKVENEALTLIARQSTGSLRDAISLLDQLASTGQTITLALAQTILGTAASQSVVDLVDALVQRQVGRGLDSIHQALDGGSDPRQFARQMVDYLRSLMLLQLGSTDQVDATPEILAVMNRQAAALDTAMLLRTLKLFNEAAVDTRGGWQPGLLLEMALAQALEDPQPTSVPAAASPPAAVPPARREPQLQAQPVPRPAPVEPRQPAAGTPPTPATSPTTADIDAPASAQQTIQQNWGKIRAGVKSARMQTEALLNSCKAVNVRDGVLVLAFASDMLKSKMDTDENLSVIRQVIQQVTGIDLPITCTVVVGRGAGGDAKIEGDSMVNTALGLGGKIVDRD